MTPTIDAAAVWPSGRVQAGAVCVYVAREDVEQVKLAATTMPHVGNALAVVAAGDVERVRDGEGQ